MAEPPHIFEFAEIEAVSAAGYDALLAGGWRHFGPQFFRCSRQFHELRGLQAIEPLRIVLADFSPSRSQRRVLARNRDIEWQIIPARVDEDAQRLFQRHKSRFTANVPASIFDFIAREHSADRPRECLEFRAMLGGRLVAASFLGVGERSASSIYGIFDPEHSRRSLGILTMLREIEWCAATGREHYYSGYSTREPSEYDYKKRFAGIEKLDWATGSWRKAADAE